MRLHCSFCVEISRSVEISELIVENYVTYIKNDRSSHCGLIVLKPRWLLDRK